MKIKDILNEEWSPESPLENTPDPLDWWDQRYVKILKNYKQAKSSPKITHQEAEMLIASDKELAAAIFDYKYANTPITGDMANKLVSIMKRIVPIDDTFYRGTETESYDEKHIMPIQSWSKSKHTAKQFGGNIYQTTSPVKGIEIGEIYYWYGNLYGDESGFGDSQAEWLLLEPEKELLDED